MSNGRMGIFVVEAFVTKVFRMSLCAMAEPAGVVSSVIELSDLGRLSDRITRRCFQLEPVHFRREQEGG